MDDKYLNRIIDTRHVEVMLGTNDRQARRIMSRIRKRLGKEKHQCIILKEFLDYTGLLLKNVLPLLGWQ